MKKLLAVSLLLASFIVNATEGTNKGPDITKIKERIYTNISKEQNVMSEFKGCIDGAQAIDAIKTCHESRKQAMQSLHEAMKAEHEANQKNNPSSRPQ